MTGELNSSSIGDLRSRLAGRALVPGEVGYVPAAAAWDESVEVTCPVVVIAADIGDIAIAARWAAEHGLGIATLNTGHGRLADPGDAVLINTAGLLNVHADRANHRMTVGPGARWSDVQPTINPGGQSGLCGASPGVGVIGYTLGGGLSPIGRTFGMAADRVHRLTVLDAEYNPIQVTTEEEPDLFWALRGGGGLGIVTELEFETVDLASLFGGGVYYAGEHAGELLTAYRGWATTLDDRTTTSIALLHLPPIPALPEQLRGAYVVHLRVAHVDPDDRNLEATGRTLIAPMVGAAPVILDYTRVMTPDQLPDIHRDPVAPMPVAYRGGHLAALDDTAIGSMTDAMVGGPGAAPSLIEVRQLGGAMRRSTSTPNAATARSSAYHLWTSTPTDPGNLSPARQLVDGIASKVGSTGLGAQLGFYGPAPATGEILSLWEKDDQTRLVAAAERLDPEGRIRTGRPIRAAAGSMA